MYKSIILSFSLKEVQRHKGLFLKFYVSSKLKYIEADYSKKNTYIKNNILAQYKTTSWMLFHIMLTYNALSILKDWWEEK